MIGSISDTSEGHFYPTVTNFGYLAYLSLQETTLGEVVGEAQSRPPFDLLMEIQIGNGTILCELSIMSTVCVNVYTDDTIRIVGVRLIPSLIPRLSQWREPGNEAS